MCFTVLNESLNKQAYTKQRRRRVAYKVVELKRNGSVSSLMRAKLWTTGVHKRSKGPSMVKGRFKHTHKSGHGIYVYTTLAMADACRYTGYGEAILKVYVKGSDLLNLDLNGRRATYDKVTVTEDQPELEWY